MYWFKYWSTPFHIWINISILFMLYFWKEYISRKISVNRFIIYQWQLIIFIHMLYYFLDVFIFLGFYLKQNINKGISYLTNAANQNLHNAQYSLSILYLKGIVIKQNIKKGIDFITISSEYRNIEACFSLGSLYHQGKYIKCDIILKQ